MAYLKRAWYKSPKEIFSQISSSDRIKSIFKPTREQIFLCVLRHGIAFIDTHRGITYLPGTASGRKQLINSLQVNVFTGRTISEESCKRPLSSITPYNMISKMPVDILRNKKQKQKRMTSDDMQIKWHEDDNNTKKHVSRMWKKKE